VPTESAQDSEDSTTTAATAPAEPTSTTSPARVTTTSISLDVPILDSSAVLAVSFLAARADRDLDVALTYLDRNVIFEWGPGGTYDTLESVWAWEDAFTVVHSTENCHGLNSSGDTTTVLCLLKVDSEVAEAAGNSPGLVCATIAVVD